MDAGVLYRRSWTGVAISSGWLVPVSVAVAYYASAHAAFLIGTLSDQIFAPFWPPNTILFCALLLTPQKKWWSIIATTFFAHVLAEHHVGMAALPMVVAFVTNCALAALNATTIRWLSSPPWFSSIRKVVVYVLATAGLNPAVVALGGAFVPALGAGSLEDFPYFWATWYVGNALACLTIGPIILTWSSPAKWPFPLSLRHIEPVLFAFTLAVACVISLEAAVWWSGSAFGPAILYLPLPIILWGAVRFGERGASTAILILTAVSIFLTLNGQSPFAAATPDRNVLAMQLFLFGIAVPVLLLSAAIDQLRLAEQTTRRLTGSLLRAQDDERRRIARDLHDSTAQNLVAASLLERSLSEALPEPLKKQSERIEDVLTQSIEELRLLAYLLHPPQLDERGLGPALRRYAEGFSERSDIGVRLDVSPEIGRLPEATEIALYRVVQEALTNVDRHSGSRSASINLTRRRARSGHVIVLCVEDEGRGFSPGVRFEVKEERGRRGVGLDSMRERISHIGGRLRIHSEPGRTTIRAVVPDH